MKLFILVMGMVMVVEGLPYFAFPERMKQVLAEIQKMAPERLRIFGLISMLAGVFLCYLAQGSGLFR
jgi:uncharacterized protein YjeT (DUF2065 family)